MNNGCFSISVKSWGFDKVRFTLDRLLTEALYNKRVGITDSEIIFLLMIKNGLQTDPLPAINQTLHIDHSNSLTFYDLIVD